MLFLTFFPLAVLWKHLPIGHLQAMDWSKVLFSLSLVYTYLYVRLKDKLHTRHYVGIPLVRRKVEWRAKEEAVFTLFAEK